MIEDFQNIEKYIAVKNNQVKKTYTKLVCDTNICTEFACLNKKNPINANNTKCIS